jgi:hypothetical protein
MRTMTQRGRSLASSRQGQQAAKMAAAHQRRLQRRLQRQPQTVLAQVQMSLLHTQHTATVTATSSSKVTAARVLLHHSQSQTRPTTVTGAGVQGCSLACLSACCAPARAPSRQQSP